MVAAVSYSRLCLTTTVTSQQLRHEVSNVGGALACLHFQFQEMTLARAGPIDCIANAQVVSASLDQTVRVWDISGLRKKTVSPGGEDVLRLPQVRAR